MDEDPAHSAQVARLALQLFDATAERHRLGDDSREVLRPPLLANVGLFVSHAGHHKHSYYVIRNSELLTGFTDREIELIAQVARVPPRKSVPRRKHPEFAALDRDDERRVRVLAGLLRVAVGLDRNHAARVASVAAVPGGDGPIVIEVMPVDSQDVSLEMYAATARSGLLAEALGASVEVVEVVDPAMRTPA